MKKRLLYLALSASLFVLTGCGGSDGDSQFDITRPIDSTLEIVLDGVFTGLDGVTLEFDGNEAVITDYGDSIFGTNPNVIPVGGALIQDIRCGTQSCSGLVGVPQISNGVLTSVKWESITIIPSEDKTITLESPSIGNQKLIPKIESGQFTSNLKRTSSCKDWWAVLSDEGKGRIWLQSWTYDDNDTRIPEPEMENNGWQRNTVQAYKFWGEDNVSYRHSYISGERVESDLGDWKDAKVTMEDSELYGCVFNSPESFIFFAPHSIIDGELRETNSRLPVEGASFPWDIVRNTHINQYGEFFNGYKIINE